MSKNLLIVFVKNPEIGRVKTRLAKSIGDDEALAVYLKLLSHSHRMTEKLTCDVAIYYGKYVDSEDFWDNHTYKKHVQRGETLGERMYNAIADSLAAGYEKVSLVGSDIYELSEKIIDQSFAKLDNKDVVIGPAKDGGYYLIGMKRPNEEIFKIKNWSTPHVFSDTIKKIESQKLTYGQTALLNDIDELEDLKGTNLLD
ncbi:glycosyltransferase [Fulvivirga sp. RKSG066]|uniref:TIGR04282 family arsenosugar biosynthesis glycosyltransferase n=1 Tax=Fulvivirga aurantia TaxID=2529383 RepID=UPI0012BCA52E|nr:TIGR04282 family arsenosugar biosynthesis glycosyltransferase [Fulvivirga aurantia]MTI22943.1 glycosyltransferase [Fulvivirga aurantia]